MTAPRTRAEETQAERRRRKPGTLDRVANLKLALPDEFADDKEHYYVWVNDTGSRVYDCTKSDDYDVVTSSRPDAKDNDPCRRPVGTDEGGRPIYAQLLRKKADFVREDERERDVQRRAQEKQLSVKPKSDDGGDKASADAVYVKESSIKHGGYTP